MWASCVNTWLGETEPLIASLYAKDEDIKQRNVLRNCPSEGKIQKICWREKLA